MTSGPNNDLLRKSAHAGLVRDPLRWREWREMRNATSHAYDEGVALEVVAVIPAFLDEARYLCDQLRGRQR